MEFKKFNAKEWRKFYKGVCENLNDDELWRLYLGVKLLRDIFKHYYEDKICSPKRFDDLAEYISYPTDELLKRLNKKQEVPY